MEEGRSGRSRKLARWQDPDVLRHGLVAVTQPQDPDEWRLIGGGCGGAARWGHACGQNPGLEWGGAVARSAFCSTVSAHKKFKIK